MLGDGGQVLVLLQPGRARGTGFTGNGSARRRNGTFSTCGFGWRTTHPSPRRPDSGMSGPFRGPLPAVHPGEWTAADGLVYDFFDQGMVQPVPQG